MQQAIPNSKIPDAVSILGRNHRVVAPVSKGRSFVFSAIDDPSAVVLDYPTTILPPTEVLLRYNRSSQAVSAPVFNTQPTVYFGIHNYELQGLLRLDYAFHAG